jgi:hypothetical protein
VTIQDKYKDLVEEAREAFGKDFNYLLDMARNSKRIKSRSRAVDSTK